MQYSVKINSLRRAVKRHREKQTAALLAVNAISSPPPKQKKQKTGVSATSRTSSTTASASAKQASALRAKSALGSRKTGLAYRRSSRQLRQTHVLTAKEKKAKSDAIKSATKAYDKSIKAAEASGGVYSRASADKIAKEKSEKYGTNICGRTVRRLVAAGKVGVSPSKMGAPRVHPEALTAAAHTSLQLKQAAGGGGTKTRDIMAQLRLSAESTAHPVSKKSNWLVKRELREGSGRCYFGMPDFLTRTTAPPLLPPF